MMYSEFVAGTGCKENDFNYKLFQKFEEIYMMSDSYSKEQIYKAAKPFCDNSKTEEEIELEKQIEAEKEELQKEIEWELTNIEMYKNIIGITTDKEEIKNYTDLIKNRKKSIRENRAKLNSLKKWF